MDAHDSVRIAVLGAAGRMGRAVVRLLQDTPGAILAAAIDAPGSPAIGRDAGELAGIGSVGVAVQASVAAASRAQVWIDFSAPEATVGAIRAAAAAGAAMVIGTTGLGEAGRVEAEAAAGRIPILLAPNMSVGVNVLFDLVAAAARALGPGYDLEIVETHHRLKRDAPSGTALRIAERLAEATGRDGAAARYARHGDVGPRPEAEIGIQAVRGGDVVGDHTVLFLGQGERIEITHRASSRDVFARGAVRAALWLRGKPAGAYDMRDVLGLGRLR